MRIAGWKKVLVCISKQPCDKTPAILQKQRYDRKRAIRMPWFAKVSRRIQRQLRIVAEETENRKPIRRG